MTYYSDDGGDGRREEVVPDLTVTIEADDNNGDYVKLMPSPDEDSPLAAAEEPSVPSRRSVVWYWVKLVLLFLCLGFLAVAVLKWVGPYLIDKEVIPIINWETKTFSPPVLTIFLFASVHRFGSFTASIFFFNILIVEAQQVDWCCILVISVPEMHRPVAASATPRGGLPTDSGDSVVTLDQVPRWNDTDQSSGCY